LIALNISNTKIAQVGEYLYPEEAELIINACPNERDRLILRTMWETGGRVSEVLSLTVEDIDVVNNVLYLITLKRKDKRGRKVGEKRKVRPIERRNVPKRKVYLFPESTLCRDLQDYVVSNKLELRDWVFQGGCRNEGIEGQVSTTHVWHLLADTRPNRRPGLSVSLGIRKLKGAVNRPVWPHLWRHGAAMNMLERIGSLPVVQMQLGHTSVTSTEVYAGLTDKARKEMIDRC